MDVCFDGVRLLRLLGPLKSLLQALREGHMDYYRRLPLWTQDDYYSRLFVKYQRNTGITSNYSVEDLLYVYEILIFPFVKE